jgi:hypothetical protein
MTRKRGAVLLGLGFGAIIVASSFIPGWPESKLGRALFWPVYLVVNAFPPPCFDRGPGKQPFCEGTPVQVIAALFGLAVSFVLYSALGAALNWPFLHRMSSSAGRAA